MGPLHRGILVVAGAFLALWVGVANATVVLNFAGLDGDNYEKPLDYYNGGTGSLGSGPGPNYGISFGADALACSGQPGGACNTSQIPGGADANTLFFLTGPGDIMNVAGGFDTGFSFYYSAVNVPGTVSVWSGLNGTGSLLASLALPVTPDGASIPGCYGANFCPFKPIGVAFSGTAMSVNFSGTANQIGFGEITLGSVTPGGTNEVPEPGAFALLALGLIGLMARRKGKDFA